jgi:hypothetical protein
MKQKPNNNTLHIKPDTPLYKALVLRAQQEQRTLHNMVLVLLRKALTQ